MQVKRQIHVGKTALQKLHVNVQYISSTSVQGMISCLFSNSNKISTTRLQSLYNGLTAL